MDDLDEYLAMLTDEDRAEVERLWALPLDEFIAEIEAYDKTQEPQE